MFLGIIFITTAIVLGCANSSVAENTKSAQDVTCKDLKSIRAIAPNEAAGVSVDFEATVTFVDAMQEFLFVQDGQDAIFVHRPDVANVAANQLVRIRGRLAKGDLLPIVSNPEVTVIGDSNPPTVAEVSVIGIEHDCRYLCFEFDVLQTVVNPTNTLLYAKTESGIEVCVEVLHPNETSISDVHRIAGKRIKFCGVLGLQIEGGAFRKPGDRMNKILGYKIFCNSPENIETVSKDDTNSEKPISAPTVGLTFLDKNSCAEGRFLTVGQICLIDDSEPKGIVVSDGSTFRRFNLHSISNLQPGLLVKLGGEKSIGSNGQSQFKVDYLRYLTTSGFPDIDSISVKRAVESFTPNRRIAIEGKPLRIEDRENGPHLILGEGNSTVAVQFQDSAKDSLASLDPSIAKKVRITGVTKTDQRCDFKLVVASHNDVMLLERKTSVSRIVAIGLGSLVAICAFAAFWINLLKSQIAQKQRFESIFDNAGCPIFVFNGNLKILDANQLAADLTGYSKDQLRDFYLTHIDTQMPEEQIKQMLIQTMNSQDVAKFQTHIIRQDKKLVDVDVHCRNLSKSDDPDKATFIAIVPDATERKKYENELKEARDEAIKANQAKSQFLASMSHELRTPLNGVIGMTQLLESTELTPTQADYLAVCRTSGETLLTVIGDVLDFSKMEANKMELEPQETKLIPLVENVVRAASLQSQTQHIDLASFVDPRLSRSVMVDCDRLRQVLFNIIGNASKFTSEGGITVSAKCSEVNDQYADVRFVVSDTGIGIPEEKIEGLFEAFEQCDSSTTRQYGGTGLGLTICRQIVELMDGRIYAQSAVGKGSDFIFEIRIPFATQELSTREGDSEIDFVPTDKRLAVIGMSDQISDHLRAMFEAYQVEARFFSEAEELPIGEFDVVLLNNGEDLETVRKFIDQHPTLSSKDAPILIPVVPPNCVIEQQQWENLGVEEPIFKPFTQTRFLKPVISRKERGELLETKQSNSISSSDSSARVLICEDNPVNQMFVEEVCRRAGIKFVICDNGQVAIETLMIDSNFDAIFMDCHMPVMDGFEASRKIRAMNQSGSIPEIPVIALTANALAGDREKCLEAGMVDYLTKPFKIEAFLEKLDANMEKLDANKVAPAKVALVSSDPVRMDARVFNVEDLTSQFNDRKFALEIAELFVAGFPDYRADLEACLNQQDVKKTISIAHRVKGSAATVKADRINSVALELESAARDSQLDDIQTQISEILSEFDNFVKALRDESAVS